MNQPLKPGEFWIDNLKDPLDSIEDIEQLFALVREKKAQLRAAAIEKASKN